MKYLFLICSFFLLAQKGSAQQKPEGLFINSKAPEFKAKDQNGNDVNLKELRKKGNVVLLFYRGNWCRFCNKQLSELQDSLSFITERGARVVAVTPEADEGVDSTVAKTGAAFPIISDKDLKISRSYDVAFNMEPALASRYKSAGIDILKINQQRVAALPVPAVYIINKEGDIIFRYFDENYRNRVSVKEILKHLK